MVRVALRRPADPQRYGPAVLQQHPGTRWRRGGAWRGGAVALAVLAVTVPVGAHATTQTGPLGAAAQTLIGVDAGWRQDGGGPGRAGYQPVTPRLNPAAARRLQGRWTAAVPDAETLNGGAVIADGTLFRSVGGQIRRGDAVTGADLGPVVEQADRVQGQLALLPADGQDVLVAESQVVDASGGQLVRRLLTGYKVNGERIWETSLPDRLTGGFTVADGLVLRASGRILTAFRLVDGAEVWAAALDGEPGFHPPVADAGRALVTVERGGGGSALLAFDLRTGTRAWAVNASGPRLIAAAGTAYTTGSDGVCAYAVSDGTRRWCDRQTLRDPQYAAVDNTLLYAIDGHGKAAAFGAGDGTVRWTREWAVAGSEVATSYWSPVTGGGVLYAVVYQFTARDGAALHRSELLAFDAKTGTLLTRLDLAFDALRGAEPVLLSGDHVYFAALEKLFAFGAAEKTAP